MAMILDAFVGNFVDKLTSMVSEKVIMVLGVKDDLRRLQRRMARIQKFLEAAERRRLEDPDINHWVSELKDVAYDADDIIDLCRIQGAMLLVDQSSSSKKTSVCFNFSLLSSCFASLPHRYQIAAVQAYNNRTQMEEYLEEKEEPNNETPVTFPPAFAYSLRRTPVKCACSRTQAEMPLPLSLPLSIKNSRPFPFFPEIKTQRGYLVAGFEPDLTRIQPK